MAATSFLSPGALQLALCFRVWLFSSVSVLHCVEPSLQDRQLVAFDSR